MRKIDTIQVTLVVAQHRLSLSIIVLKHNALQ